MLTLSLSHAGPIGNAQVNFGDLTVLVGPQATGKSILLQFLKLVEDTGYVLAELKRHGLYWGGRVEDFFDIYFGEGMKSLWQSGQTRLSRDGKNIDLARLVQRQRRDKAESLFFIPAQRVLTLRDGWPRPFTDYRPGDPFAVRDFSERLRWLMETEFAGTRALFPVKKRLKKQLRDLLNKALFRDFDLRIASDRSQKRLVLGPHGGAVDLPFMVWSAGQREFVPLLLGLYWLLPPSATSMRRDVKWVVIEEPEMGLHPLGISAVMVSVLDLLHRGYRVCLSTHSPQVIDVIWAVKALQRHDSDGSALLDLFQLPHVPNLISLAQDIMRRDVRVYYFEGKPSTVRDISELDPGANDRAEAGWGGLTEFSGRTGGDRCQVGPAGRKR